jgi:hypothetical protein
MFMIALYEMVKPKDFQSPLKSFVVLNVGEYDLPSNMRWCIEMALSILPTRGSHHFIELHLEGL